MNPIRSTTNRQADPRSNPMGQQSSAQYDEWEDASAQGQARTHRHDRRPDERLDYYNGPSGARSVQAAGLGDKVGVTTRAQRQASNDRIGNDGAEPAAKVTAKLPANGPGIQPQLQAGSSKPPSNPAADVTKLLVQTSPNPATVVNRYLPTAYVTTFARTEQPVSAARHRNEVLVVELTRLMSENANLRSQLSRSDRAALLAQRDRLSWEAHDLQTRLQRQTEATTNTALELSLAEVKLQEQKADLE